MNKCTQNSEKTLASAVIDTILSNVNVGIRFYQRRPTIGMRLSLEETIIENMTFAELVASQSVEGRYVLEKLRKMNNDVMHQLDVSPIELPESDTPRISREEYLKLSTLNLSGTAA